MWLAPACYIGATASLFISHSPSEWRLMGLAGVLWRLLLRTLTFVAVSLLLQALALGFVLVFFADDVFN